MVDDLSQLNSKLDSIIDVLQQMEKNQKETTETLSLLTEELAKLQKIVEQTVK